MAAVLGDLGWTGSRTEVLRGDVAALDAAI
jgi:hypothetical protein